MQVCDVEQMGDGWAEAVGSEVLDRGVRLYWRYANKILRGVRPLLKMDGPEQPMPGAQIARFLLSSLQSPILDMINLLACNISQRQDKSLLFTRSRGRYTGTLCFR